MYWNDGLEDISDGYQEININMRCIEMYTAMTGQPAFNRLTLTWDVLKFSFCVPPKNKTCD